MQAKRTQLYKFISLSLKTIIVTTAFWFIYKRLNEQDELLKLNKLFTGANWKSVGLLGLILFGAAINWSLEALKWHLLVGKIETVTFFGALKAVLAGLTVSIFTPNRAGEVGGRIFYLRKANHIEAACLSFIGGFIQLIITVIAGGAGLIYLTYYNSFSYNFFTIPPYAIIAFILLALFSIVVFQYLRKSKKLRRYFALVRSYNVREIARLTSWSFLRYLVFSIQFLLLLLYFKISAPVFMMFAAIAVTFLFVSAIPTFFITELGIRGSVSVAVIGIFSSNTSGILAASTLLWIINIALPAVIGAAFVFRLKFFRKHLHE